MKLKEKKGELSILVCCVLLEVCLVSAMFYVELSDKAFIYGVVGSVVSCVFIYGMLMTMIRLQKKKSMELAKVQMLSKQAELKNYYQEETINLYNALEQMEQKTNAYLDELLQLLDEQKYEEVADLMAICHDTYEKNENLFLSGNEVIDVVLSQKISRARRKQIHIKCDVQSIYLTHIMDHDLCSLLSNILDNAIEATEKCKDKTIRLSIRKNQNCLVIQEENPYEEVLYDKKKRLKTTKQKKEEHGLGLVSMKQIVKQYNGMMKYHLENGIFKITVVIEDSKM